MPAADKARLTSLTFVSLCILVALVSGTSNGPALHCVLAGFGYSVLSHTALGVTYLYHMTRKFSPLCVPLHPGNLVMADPVFFGRIIGCPATASPSSHPSSMRWFIGNIAQSRRACIFVLGFRISRVPMAPPPWSSMWTYGSSCDTPHPQIPQTCSSGDGLNPVPIPPPLSTCRNLGVFVFL